MKKKLLGYLRVLFTPACWVRIYPVSKPWDKELNELMLTHNFVVDGDSPVSPHFMVKLGDKVIWVTNHPYASFSEIDYTEERPFCDRKMVLPKRITALRAMDKLNKDIPAETRKNPYES